jgi:hypothetical protein
MFVEFINNQTIKDRQFNYQSSMALGSATCFAVATLIASTIAPLAFAAYAYYLGAAALTMFTFSIITSKGQKQKNEYLTPIESKPIARYQDKEEALIASASGNSSIKKVWNQRTYQRHYEISSTGIDRRSIISQYIDKGKEALTFDHATCPENGFITMEPHFGKLPLKKNYNFRMEYAFEQFGLNPYELLGGSDEFENFIKAHFSPTYYLQSGDLVLYVDSLENPSVKHAGIYHLSDELTETVTSLWSSGPKSVLVKHPLFLLPPACGQVALFYRKEIPHCL